jgi:hypothetical protein
MKKGMIFLSMFSILMLPVNAQVPALLVGKWKFLDVCQAELKDSNNIKMTRKFFGDMTIYFKQNNHYKTTVTGMVEEGNWAMEETTHKITLTANKGTVNQIGIVTITKDSMVIFMRDQKPPFMLLKRTAVESSDTAEEALPKPVLAGVTLSQVSKRWWVKRVERPGMAEESIKMLSDFVKGSYLEFKANGEYASVAFDITDRGNWTFGPDKNSVIVSSGNLKKIWNIKSISETELVLIKGNTREIWNLTATE